MSLTLSPCISQFFSLSLTHSFSQCLCVPNNLDGSLALSINIYFPIYIERKIYIYRESDLSINIYFPLSVMRSHLCNAKHSLASVVNVHAWLVTGTSEMLFLPPVMRMCGWSLRLDQYDSCLDQKGKKTSSLHYQHWALLDIFDFALGYRGVGDNNTQS